MLPRAPGAQNASGLKHFTRPPELTEIKSIYCNYLRWLLCPEQPDAGYAGFPFAHFAIFAVYAEPQSGQKAAKKCRVTISEWQRNEINAAGADTIVLSE